MNSAVDLVKADFSGTYEQDHGVLKGELNLGGIVEVDGNTNLSEVIHFSEGGYVEAIQYVPQTSVFPNQIQVLGQAPSRINGHIDMVFKDSEGSTYSLSIYATNPEQHTLDIFGHPVTIVEISWERA
ncbi:hypothetical protein [Vibrio mangrovi]|uniref:Uncharacterized protein n=1 Tax=Vibrio mangrovi TaxID=474394 RepID=A0A1Y6IT10_9VIBR|nr:hypothetical protein [Vibrio mangrovi]MDW6003990.1 hypothetical protein [Vibrio mangrovi]SMR99213.1 hypothetical protein VIM7927_00437 [Vibrio mangrovi]